MRIQIQGAHEHNLQGLEVEFGEGLTVVTGISGSGKTSLVFDTLYHEARRRFLEVFELGSPKGRLAPANVDAIIGLGPAVAVGQNLLNRNPNSTLATASGLHPFLRLLYAHFGKRSCPHCGMSLEIYTEDEILQHLSELAGRGAVSITALLVHGIQGSHTTLLAGLVDCFGMNRIWVDEQPCQGMGLDAGKPHDIELQISTVGPGTDLAQLRSSLQEVIALGAQAVAIHGYGQVQRLARTPACIRCGAWFGELHPVDFNRACPDCNGQGCQACHETGLMPQASTTRWGGLRFTEFLQHSVDAALELFINSDQTVATARLRREIIQRLAALQQVGLGYINLNRPVPTLSRGEAQRVRLGLTLISRLEDMLHVLDEPTVGQHPADIQRLLPALRELAGPVVFVEHDRTAAAGADQALELGPGAGHLGGRIVFSGTPKLLWQADTATGQYFSKRKDVLLPEKRPPPNRFLTIRGASLRNLQNIDVPIPLGRLCVIAGVSGSGKSTLVEDVLVPSLLNHKPSGCHGIDGPQLHPILVDQSPIGRNPRSNPATYTKLSDIIRDLFATITGLPAANFSFNRPEGACNICDGRGAVEVSMRYLPSSWIPCTECEGRRFTDTVLAAKLQAGKRQYSIADFYELSIEEVRTIFGAETRLPKTKLETARQILDALYEIGLGYLTLGQASTTLSGGEAQRVKLARYLGKKSLTKDMLVLDEPTTGLHPQDLIGLLGVLDRLVRAGATIVVVEHNTDVIRAADWVIDLGPGAGLAGGQMLFAGPPEGLLECSTSLTGQSLCKENQLIAAPLQASSTQRSSQAIAIRGARVHNLQNVNVDIPKGKLTVVTGLSGSGKSSLVHDVLEAEARRRYLESLSLYERQGLHEGAEAEVEAVTGLGVALTIGAERLVFSRRATVGTATEITPLLAVLLAHQGERSCLKCGSSMERGTVWVCKSCGERSPLAAARHFTSSTYAAACQKCNGIGSLQVPNPTKLLIHPEKPLVEGAMYSPGFFPNGYLGKPFNGGYYLTLALAEYYGFDIHTTPWNQISAEAQQAFLFGSEMELTVTYYSRTGRSNTYRAKFPGFYGFIRDWDVGGTYSDNKPCAACGGTRLRPEYLAVRLAGSNIYELEQMTLVELEQRLAGIEPARPEMVCGLNTISQRLGFLIQVGLGYLNLERTAGTLSAGEVQRIRLASLLGSGLTSLTVLLDEPTRSLHPAEVDALLSALKALRDVGNTVIVVEHDLQVMRSADHLIDMGPGAGQNGGQIVAVGTPEQVSRGDTFTGRWLRGERRMQPRSQREPHACLTIHGAHSNNLKGERIDIPLGILVGVCGVSGSGKSTLVADTLGRALAPKKQTTSVAYEPVDPGEYDSIEGAPPRTLVVDQSRAGLSSPATFLDLARPIQSIYAASPEAQLRGLNEVRLAERCSVCDGRGRLTLDMTFLPDVHITCETCRGTGYTAEAWEVHLNDLALPEVFARTIDEVYTLFGDDPRLHRPLQMAQEVGLGYLVLRQPGYALSGGEAQRLKIARELCRKSVAGSFYILDEPSIGQHLEDVLRLSGVLHRLVDEGGSVLVVEHHTHLLATCDWLLELGPSGGAGGGHVIASGRPEQVAAGNTPTAPYLRGLL